MRQEVPRAIPMKTGKRTNGLARFLTRFRRKRVAILGDLMLDEYVWGQAHRISPEAPIPVIEVQKTVSHPGGAANVAENVLALGATPVLFGVVGRDPTGQALLARLRTDGADTAGVVEEENRITTKKTRIIAHNQQVVRVDQECTQPISYATQEELAEHLRGVLAGIDALILSDYGKGVIVSPLIRKIWPLVRRTGVRCYVDSKGHSVRRFRGVFLAKLAKSEAERITHLQIVDKKSLTKAARTIAALYRCKYVVITEGPQGMSVFLPPGRLHKIQALAREVYDVTGAGDTVIATLALALSAGATLIQAARLASVAAGIVVGKVGTAVPTLAEIRRQLRASRQQAGF